MIDENIKQTLKEISEILNPKPMKKLISHLNSLFRDINDLTKSRDNWRNKYEELKSSNDARS